MRKPPEVKDEHATSCRMRCYRHCPHSLSGRRGAQRGLSFAEGMTARQPGEPASIAGPRRSVRSLLKPHLYAGQDVSGSGRGSESESQSSGYQAHEAAHHPVRGAGNEADGYASPVKSRHRLGYHLCWGLEAGARGTCTVAREELRAGRPWRYDHHPQRRVPELV